MGIYRGTGGTGDSTTDTTVTTVTEKAAEAASSATSAANSATSAANSASSASTSETNAATSATNAANSATASATSATNSASDANSASTSATNAANSAYNASVYRNETQTLKTQTESLKDTTILAATAASGHADDAETAYANTLAIYGSTTDVQNAVNSASASATTATTKAAEAASSATDASNYSSSAGTSATQAASSASQAATSAASANSYATDAQTAQTAAETAQAAAEAAEYNINGLYLGSLANDPTLDGNGVAVTTGDLYFNTTEQEVRVYTDGDVWEPVVDLAGDITVNSLTSNNNVVVKGNLEVQGTTITVDSATAQTIDLGDNDRIRLGDSDDLQMYHDGTDSYIANSTGTLKLSGNTDISGNITVSGTVDGRDIAADGATLDAVASTYVDVSGDTLTGDLVFGDDVSASFGAGGDLTITHESSGANSVIRESGTGSLYIDATSLFLRGRNFENMAKLYTDGGVELYHNNNRKFQTTSTGIDVTGTVTADGLTVDGDVLFDKTTSGANKVLINASGGNNSRLVFCEGALAGEKYNIGFNSSDASFNIYHQAGAASRLKLQSNGDISFYEDAGTSQDFYWDASTSRLGLGTTTPSASLDINGSGTIAKLGSAGISGDVILNLNDGRGFIGYNGNTLATVVQSGTAKILDFRVNSGTFGDGTRAIKIDSNNDISFHNDAGNSQDFYWDASTSRLGLGTTSPDTVLHVENGATSYTWTPNGRTAAIIEGNNFSGTTLSIIGTNSSNLIFTSGTTEAMRIDSSGRLGIGTTSPDTVLHVENGATSYTWTPNGRTAAIIEGNNFSGTTLSIIGKSTGYSGIFFGDEAFETDGQINYDHTAGAMRFATRGSEKVRIDSSGNVGIGTTNPSSAYTGANNLVIGGGSAEAGLTIYSSTTTDGNIYFADGTAAEGAAAYRGYLEYSHNSNYFRIGVNGSERMRIDSNGRLGIGTTSPATNSKLTLDNPDSLYTLAIRGTTKGLRIGTSSGAATIQATDSTLTGSYQPLQVEGSQIIFSKSGSEAARIDSSGNLLVGGTVAGASTSTTLYASGLAQHKTNNAKALIVDRSSSDGDIVEFRKDGTTVGSIGTTSGDLYIHSTATNHRGLRFGQGFVSPITATATTSDGGCDLGEASARFKDLYLSGGVYLGGTGADNLLDDYEEGTWTPVLTMTTSGDMTATANGATYTKVGRMVHFTCYMSGIDGTSPTPSGFFRLTGLPFTSVGSNTYTPINVGFNSILSLSDDKPYSGYVQSGNTYVVFTEGNTSIVNDADVGSGGQIMVSGVYQTA